jgi:hypothetical protein
MLVHPLDQNATPKRKTDHLTLKRINETRENKWPFLLILIQPGIPEWFAPAITLVTDWAASAFELNRRPRSLRRRRGPRRRRKRKVEEERSQGNGVAYVAV